MFDGKAFGAEIVGVVKGYLETQLSPVIARIDALEKQIAALPTPKDGKDADPHVVAGIVTSQTKAELAEMRAAIAAIQPAPELPDIAGMIERAVDAIPAPLAVDDVQSMIDESIAAIPAPAPVEPPAIDPSDDQIREWAGRVAEVINLPVPKDGKSVTVEEMRPLVDEIVETRLAAIPAPTFEPSPDQLHLWARQVAEFVQLPVPKDGKSVTVDDVLPMLESMVAKAIAALPVAKDGKDGVGVAGAVIDRYGNLTLTLTDGTTRDLGLVVGKDGEPGKPGADGLGFDDVSEEMADDGRTIITRYVRGERIKEFRHSLAVVLDRGVFKDGTEYQAGDSVTYGGSIWIAQRATTEKPETIAKDWRLSVKRGRDGKDGVMKAEKSKEPLRVGVPTNGGH